MSSACLKYYNTAPAKRNLLIAGTVAVIFAFGVAIGLVATSTSRGIFNEEQQTASSVTTASQRNATIGQIRSPSPTQTQSPLSTLLEVSLSPVFDDSTSSEIESAKPSSLPSLLVHEVSPNQSGVVLMPPVPTIFPTSFPTVTQARPVNEIPNPSSIAIVQQSKLPTFSPSLLPTVASEVQTPYTLQPVPPFLSETLRPSSFMPTIDLASLPFLNSGQDTSLPTQERQPTLLNILTSSPTKYVSPKPNPKPTPQPIMLDSPLEPSITPTTKQPTPFPTPNPTSRPTYSPTTTPSSAPTVLSISPTVSESRAPSGNPTEGPSSRPPSRTRLSQAPSANLTLKDTPLPTAYTVNPATLGPANLPTSSPIFKLFPSISPTIQPEASNLLIPPTIITATTRTIFCAMSDVPFIELERPAFQAQVENLSKDCEFLIHLGGIKSENRLCTAEWYEFAHDTLRLSPKPTFILLGENESRKCPNTDKSTGINLWRDNFLLFDKFWVHRFPVEYMDYSFHFVHKQTLFFGLNLGGTDPNVLDWEDHLLLLGEYVIETLIETIPSRASRIVLMFHGVPNNDNELFFGPLVLFLREAWLQRYPILLLHGDGHQFMYNRTEFDGVPNVLEIQLRGGSAYKPLQITVNSASYGVDLESTFSTDWGE